MKRRTLVSFVVVLSTLAVASFAHAQATRTWVSGVGDDANPCSRTAPCKTYAGAISKTAAGGIISTLDPGGFGAVTITKSITIEGTGTLGHILNSLVNGVIINAATTDVVVLRDLSLHGAGNGLNGVRILGAAEVYFQNVNIQNNAGDGIEIAPNVGTLTRVFVENSRIVNNTGKGIEVLPSGTATVQLVVQNSELSGNTSRGIDLAGNNNSVAIYNSKLTHNGNTGAQIQLTNSTLFIEGSLDRVQRDGRDLRHHRPDSRHPALGQPDRRQRDRCERNRHDGRLLQQHDRRQRGRQRRLVERGPAVSAPRSPGHTQSRPPSGGPALSFLPVVGPKLRERSGRPPGRPAPGG